MTRPIPIRLATLEVTGGAPSDDAYDVDSLLTASEKAARFAVDHGDGGTQEVAYWMDSLRLVLTALVVVVQELSRLPAKGNTGE
jgi:hypothetical protein